MQRKSPIGIFDSGVGGLSIYKSFNQLLPEYDFIYLGDTARCPYGNKSFEVIYQYTYEGVKKLFDLGCNLVILACNTASAVALRTIQQKDLYKHQTPDNPKRVLGIVVPTIEYLAEVQHSQAIGLLATVATVRSQSYVLEIQKKNKHIQVFQQACPLWVPIIENKEFDTPGADYFVQKNIQQLLTQSPHIDAIMLACTHYPFLINTIKQFTHLPIIQQGDIIAKSLQNYLQKHTEIICSKNAYRHFYTTDTVDTFNELATIFLNQSILSERIIL